jgi:hypothetical protein
MLKPRNSREDNIKMNIIGRAWSVTDCTIWLKAETIGGHFLTL